LKGKLGGMSLKVLITAPLTQDSLDELFRMGLEIEYHPWHATGKLHLSDSLLSIVKDTNPDILIVEGDEVKEEIITESSLKLIGSVRGTPNNVDVDFATSKNIPVVAAPGRNTNAVAELTLALILSQSRNIVKTDRMLVRDEFMVDNFSDFAKMYTSSMGFELAGKTVGIIGLGRIGYEVAKKLRCFGVKLLVYDPFVQVDKLESIDAENMTLENLLRESDIVTIHCMPTPDTKGMLGKEEFAMMKESSILINTSRASITDEYALHDALKNKKIAGAALDVFSMEPVDCDNVFLELDNVIVTPHIGGNTIETIERQSRIILNEIKAFVNGEQLEFCLNPEVFE